MGVAMAEAMRRPDITDGAIADMAIVDIMAEGSTWALGLLMGMGMVPVTSTIPVMPTIPVIATIRAILTARSPPLRHAPRASTTVTATGFQIPTAIPIDSNTRRNTNS